MKRGGASDEVMSDRVERAATRARARVGSTRDGPRRAGSAQLWSGRVGLGSGSGRPCRRTFLIPSAQMPQDSALNE